MNRRRILRFRAFFILSLTLWSTASIKVIAETSLKPNDPDKEEQEHLLSKPESTKYKKPLKTSATTLPGIIQEALKEHPNITAEKEALNASSDVVDQAIAGYMPTIDLRASLGRENIRRNFQINALSPLPSVGKITTTRTDPSFTIRQILFDGMGTASRVNRAKSQHYQARGNLGVTTDTATIDAATAAIDVRRLQRLLRIVDSNIRFHQFMKQRIEEIVQAGAAPISDLYQAESRLQDTFVSKANIQSDLEVAMAKFIEVVGKEPPDHIKRIKLPPYLTSMTAEMAVRMALDNNNNIKVARSNVQIAESTHRESESKLVPTVTVEVEGERDRNTSGSSGFQNRFTAMVVARHNLFNGGADLAKSRETVKRVSESQARLSQAMRQTERTIRSALGEFRNAQKKSAHLTKLIQEKRQIRDTYLSEFDLGRRSLNDILDTANDVFITEATRTTVDASQDINAVVLSVGTGQFKKFLDNKDSQDLDQEAKIDEDTSDLISKLSSPEEALTLTSYTPAPAANPVKPQKISKVKKEPARRKSIFEMRQAEREKAAEDKTTA